MPNRRVLGQASQFRGVSNTLEASLLGLGWAQQAENLDLDDSRVYRERPGRVRVGEGGYAAFATQDGLSFYLARGNELLHIDEGLEQTVIRSGLAPLPLRFAEVAGRVYCTNGTDFLVLEGPTARQWGIPVPSQPGVVRELASSVGGAPAGLYQFVVTYRAVDGRESGASPVVVVQVEEGEALRFELPRHEDYETVLYATTADGQVLYRLGQPSYWDGRVTDTGAALRTLGRYPPPGGNIVAAFAGALMLGQYLPEQEASVIWRSDPLSYELFDLYNYIAVEGEVRCMISDDAWLYIGTDTRVYSWQPEGRLAKVLDYGVPEGAYAGMSPDRVPLMWTRKGLVMLSGGAAENLTEAHLDPARGDRGGLAVVEQDSHTKVLVTYQKGQ